MACKYGKLKNPVRTPAGGKRVCRKAPKKGRGRASAANCRYGKLKNPIKGRVCRKRPGGRRRR
jgi:hypothetical protein